MNIAKHIFEITKKKVAPDDKELILKIFSCVDYTSLETTDNENSIKQLVSRVNSFEKKYSKNVAAICVFPNFIETVKTHLFAHQVKIASVGASFPFSQTFTETKIFEIEQIVKSGADEIDIVLPIGLLLNRHENRLLDELKLIKQACQTKHLKIILETGLLKNNVLVQRASELAIEGGADFIKTSTGKNQSMASLEAVYIMCLVIEKHYKTTGKYIGIKPAGGISTFNSSLQYLSIVQEILGDDWCNNTLFRIGASSLINDILSKMDK